MPKQLNVIARKPDKFSFLICFCEGNGAEDYQVVINVEIGRGLVFEQSLVVGVHVKELPIDFYFRAGYQFTVKNLVQVLKNIVGRDVSDVRGNGICLCVTFESEKSKL